MTRSNYPPLKPYVLLTGSAKGGNVGPPIGLVDIGVSEDAYLFRVSLPGVDECNLTCEIEHDGRVYIEGVIGDGSIFDKSSGVYQMRAQQLCPPGPFTISFNLPGPIDPRLFSPNLRSDGILEAMVRKYRELPKPVVDSSQAS